MTETTQIDLKTVFTSDEVDLDVLMDATGAVYGSKNVRNELRNILEEWNNYSSNFSKKVNEGVKQGYANWLVGNEDKGLEILSGVKSTHAGAFLYANCLKKAGRTDEALKVVSSISKKSDNIHLALFEIELLVENGDLDAAAKKLKSIESAAKGHAEYHYVSGLIKEAQGFYDEAVEEYARVLKIKEGHGKARFRLALNYDRMGRDAESVELYEKFLESTPLYKNAVINLGVLYEDMGKYQKALDCFKLVLKSYPDDEKAKLYYTDSFASLNMVVHEELEREQDRRSKILQTPVTDFELSVRSRNCLNKMNIASLGDLITKTEAELLSYKNFGETSLAEIKEMLKSKGLRLGMSREKKDSVQMPPIMSFEENSEGGESDDILDQPIDKLDLSIRSRKCMDRLGITTIGELASRSEAELLASKNFGMTSLNEVKRKLGDMNLALAES